MILMLLTGTGLGALRWLRLYKRVATLRQISLFINRIAERIRFTSIPIGDLLIALSDSPEFRDCEFVHMLAAGATCENEREQWGAIIRQNGKEWGLTPSDSAIVIAFFGAIGFGDVDSEIHLCREYEELLRAQLTHAEEELKIKGKVYLTLGLCLGSASALLLW